MHQYLEKYRFLKGCSLLFERYYDHRVARDSAALTYYMLFALFPLMIFVNNLVGIMDLNIDSLVRELSGIVPSEVLELAEQYLSYVSADSSRTLLLFSLIFSIYFPYRAAGALMLSVRKAYGMGRPEHFLRYQGKLLLYTLSLILTMALSLATVVLGNRAISFIGRYFPIDRLGVRLWASLRFVILGVFVFFVIALLYGIAQEQKSINRIWPGVSVSLAMWLLISWLFSLYVENAARYSVIYGSIGTVIVLLLWLYLASVMLIMGAEFNSVLLELRKKA